MNEEQESQGSEGEAEPVGLPASEGEAGPQEPPGPEGEAEPQRSRGWKHALSKAFWVVILILSVLLCIGYSVDDNYTGGVLMFVATLLALYLVLT